MNTPETTNREFFAILDEFFTKATGTKYSDFSTPEGFGDRVRSQASVLAARAQGAYRWAARSLPEFYNKHKTDNLSAGRTLGGVKLVLGGSSRFGVAHLDTVKKMLLYADTVLIPDPILPWLETERQEERFKRVLLLETAHQLLHLKPLVDVDLPYPAVLVFPSWEKSLEERDAQTWDGIKRLVVSFLSHYLGIPFGDLREIFEYVAQHESEFLCEVNKKGLFVAPEGTIGSPLKGALTAYRANVRKWKSGEYLSHFEKLTDGGAVLNGLMERLGPQYHLLENAEVLGAQPMISVPAQCHYYALCAQLFEARLTERQLLDKTTVAAIRGLNTPQLKWLSTVPVQSLVELRQANENEPFRRKLEEFIGCLHSASLEDLNLVVAQVGRGISSLLGEYRKTLREIDSKYSAKHAKTIAVLGAATAAALVPSLAPFLGAPALAGVVKYAHDKIDESRERRAVAKSMMGVLAMAQKKQ